MVSIRPCPTYDGMPDLPSAPSYRSHFCWLAWIFSLSVYPAFQVFWLGCPRGRWAARPAPAPRGSNGSRGQIAAFLPVRGSRQMPRLPANSVAAPGCSIAHTAGFATRISRLRAAFPHRLASGLCERKSAGSRLALLYAAACLCSFQPVPRLYHLVHHWGYSNRAAARKCRKERHSAAFSLARGRVPGNVAGVERRGVGERQGLEIKKVQVCKSVYGNNKFDGNLLRNF